MDDTTKNKYQNSIRVLKHFNSVIKDSFKSEQERKTALEGIHETVKMFGRNTDYADFMIEFGNKSNQQEDAIPKTILLTEDFIRQLELRLQGQ